MNHVIKSLVLAISLALAALASTTPASAAVNECAAPAPGETVICSCDIDAPQGAVWGAGIYTDDSPVCTAAAHAGALKVAVDGAMTRWVGIVEVRGAEGCQSYAGTEANGIVSSPYGAWGRSIYFPALSDGSCLPEGILAAACPTNMTAAADPVTCWCPASALTGATVWGTDTYTGDSALCVAALHAGIVTAEGGYLTAVPLGPQQSFAGTERNGVVSRDYGAFGTSFRVEKASL